MAVFGSQYVKITRSSADQGVAEVDETKYLLPNGVTVRVDKKKLFLM